jgi:hypothetical protein
MKNNNRDRIAMALVISTLSWAGIGIAADSLRQSQEEQKREKDEKQQPRKEDRQQDRAQKQSEQKHQQQEKAQRESEQDKKELRARQQQQQERIERQAEQIQQQRAQQQQKQEQIQRQRLSQQQQQQRIKEQQQRVAQYRQHLEQQERLAEQHIRALQQQKRMAQYRYQEQYLERLRQQELSLRNDRFDYDNDPYFYTAPIYRYNRSGRYYEINEYGARTLRQAVHYGYEEGFRAGKADRDDRWRSNYKDSYAYRDANYGYRGYYVSRDDYNYYFREGFRRGYEDGFNSRYRYGRLADGHPSILETILTQILRFQNLR